MQLLTSPCCPTGKLGVSDIHMKSDMLSYTPTDRKLARCNSYSKRPADHISYLDLMLLSL